MIFESKIFPTHVEIQLGSGSKNDPRTIQGTQTPKASTHDMIDPLHRGLEKSLVHPLLGCTTKYLTQVQDCSVPHKYIYICIYIYMHFIYLPKNTERGSKLVNDCQGSLARSPRALELQPQPGSRTNTIHPHIPVQSCYLIYLNLIDVQ